MVTEFFYCMDKSSLIIPLNSCFCVPQKKKSHKGFKQYEGEEMMTELTFLSELSLFKTI